MKHLLTLILNIFLLSSCGNTSNTNSSRVICENENYDYCVKVIFISDGDTFRGLTEDNEEIKFRIFGIDAPERHQAFGKRSTQYHQS